MEKKDMEWLMKMLDEKLNNQTFLITNSVTKNVMEALDEKMRCITEENNILKSKVSELQLEVKFLKNEKRKNNLIFFGVEEIGKTECELVDCIMEAIIESGTHFQSNEISNIYRIGKRINNKNRPVVVSITSLWKKHIILRNKSKLPQGIYIKEDYSKEVLEIRKQLQMQVEQEKKKGNIAYIKHDKLIVKKNRDNNPEKRKREESGSPNSSNQKKTTSSNQKNNPLHQTPQEKIS
ncbi:uncharacterized protein [Choristoneura fumiferana]|uniref:uncharacterized protein n=1 Tax=Choristoneura fumiferana TaxID=7141 RepID=UPI003D15C7C5